MLFLTQFCGNFLSAPWSSSCGEKGGKTTARNHTNEVKIFFRGTASAYSIHLTSHGQNAAALCAVAPNPGAALRQTLWELDRPTILTSATLAVGGSFRHFRSSAGLANDGRVMETAMASPFDYYENCLLYLPVSCLETDWGGEDYYELLTSQVLRLLAVSNGHALILMTSYEGVAALTERLQREKLRWPLFILSRNAHHVLEAFRASPGAVLVAAGAAWEGLDFPGDCVSLLIIPRLPFPFPDALKRREQERYPSLRAYLQAVAVPEMQLRLKQGFGRAIRTETDTCVVAVLDERAQRGHRYFEAVRTALPKLRITASLRVVERFLREKKGEDYYKESNK